MNAKRPTLVNGGYKSEIISIWSSAFLFHLYFTKTISYSAIFHHLRMSYLDSREVDDYDMDDDATVTIAGTI